MRDLRTTVDTVTESISDELSEIPGVRERNKAQLALVSLRELVAAMLDVCRTAKDLLPCSQCPEQVLAPDACGVPKSNSAEGPCSARPARNALSRLDALLARNEGGAR